MLARSPFPFKAIQVDGGSEFTAEFEDFCQCRGIRLCLTASLNQAQWVLSASNAPTRTTSMAVPLRLLSRHLACPLS